MCHKCRGDRANHLYPSSISYYQNFEIVMDFYVLFDAIYSLRWSKTFFHIIFVFLNPCYFSMYKKKFFYPPVSYKTIFTFTFRQIGEKWTGKDANMRAQIKLHRGKEADRLVSGVGVQNQVCNRLQKIIDLSRIPSSCYCCVMCVCLHCALFTVCIFPMRADLQDHHVYLNGWWQIYLSQECDMNGRFGSKKGYIQITVTQMQYKP